MWKLIITIIIFFIVFWMLWRLLSSRYSLPCPAWLGWMLEVDNPLSRIHGATNIIELLELQQGMKVLDAGCGPGRLTIPMAKKVGSTGTVAALDIQEKMLDRVKEKAHNARLNNIVFIHAGLGDGKLKQDTYDRATLITVLGEIPNQKQALQEIFDTLKPGGILSITETLFDPHYQRLEGVLNLAQQIGFQKKKVGSDWFSYNLLLSKPA